MFKKSMSEDRKIKVILLLPPTIRLFTCPPLNDFYTIFIPDELPDTEATP